METDQPKPESSEIAAEIERYKCGGTEEYCPATEEVEQLREQLAAEREKYKRSQEKVREYFDLLAAERERATSFQMELAKQHTKVEQRDEAIRLLAAERKKNQ